MKTLDRITLILMAGMTLAPVGMYFILHTHILLCIIIAIIATINFWKTFITNWSPVHNPKEKPLKWWYYKVLCEFWYNWHKTSNKRYYLYLNALCDMGWNLYGHRIYDSYERNKDAIEVVDKIASVINKKTSP